VNEAHVVASGAAPNAAGRKVHAARFEPRIRCSQVVDPQTEVIERWRVRARSTRFVDRLHEIDFDRADSLANAQNVLVDVLRLTSERADTLDPQEVDPQWEQAPLVARTESDLLNAQHAKRSHGTRP
jgi:hypothetical protein